MQDILQKFAAFEANLNGQANSVMHKTRKQAIAIVEKLGFPTTKHEEWKYTNLKKVLDKNYQVAENYVPKSDFSTTLLQLENVDENVLVFVNGCFIRELSRLNVDENVVIVEDLLEASRKYPTVIENYFGKYANTEQDSMVAYNTAFAKQGVFIHVKANTVLETPIFIHSITDTSENHILSQPRNLIIVEKNSKLTIIEKHKSFGENAGFVNMVTEIVAAPNSEIDHYRLQNDTPTVSHISTTQVFQEKDSRYTNTTITLNGELIRNNLNVIIHGENCETTMNGLFAPTGKTHIDNHTLADHQKPHSVSHELYKGLLDGNSSGVFNGKIYVRQDAQKTNAFQSNKNILLSPNAVINTKPQLEIWADDVKCSHGCTTGALDEEPMFYLRSRGIPETEARALLMFAFADDVLARIKVPSLRLYVEKVIAERLNVSIL
jgi:Fe-S cluster assembly protein SufD